MATGTGGWQRCIAGVVGFVGISLAAAACATNSQGPARGSGAPGVASCSPISNEGTCYRAGEYCRDSDHGITGTAGDGEQIVCEDNDGWRWEAAGDSRYSGVSLSGPASVALPSVTAAPTVGSPATAVVLPPTTPPTTAVDFGRQYLNIVDPIDNNQTNWIATIQAGQIDDSALLNYVHSYQTASSALETVSWPVNVISDMEAEISAFQLWANDLGVVLSDLQLGQPLPDEATMQHYAADFRVVNADAIKVRADLGLSSTGT